MRICLVAFCSFAALALSAQDYSARYRDLPVEMSQVSLPVFPDLRVSLLDFGAKGDGVTLNTDAFQQAMAFLSKKGGGHLDVPAGVWFTGPIEFKDNVDLHLAQGALIIFSPERSLYVREGSTKMSPLISASKRTNVAITGKGIIDGNGKYWRPVKRSKVSDVEWKDYKAMGGTESDGGKLWFAYNLHHVANMTSDPKKEEAIRADLIRFTECSNVLFEGVVIQNSPRFHLHPVRSSNIIVDGVTIRCPWNAQNGDGLDLSNCKTCLIVNTTVDVGDDGICMKGGMREKGLADGPCKDILIEDNVVYHAHGGFVIGSDVSGGMQNIVVRNCSFSGTDVGLRFKSAVFRGGKTEGIYCSNITMNDIRDAAILFSCEYVDKKYQVDGSSESGSSTEQFSFVPDFTDIHIDNVVCREAKTAIYAHGIEGYSAVHDISISNTTIFYTNTGKDIDDKTASLKLDNVNLFTFEQ